MLSKLNSEWFNSHVLMFLDMDQTILGYHYTSTGISYGPIAELVNGLCYLCGTYHISIVTVTSAANLKTATSIRREYERHSPMWELAKHVCEHLPKYNDLDPMTPFTRSTTPIRGQRIMRYLRDHWDDPDFDFKHIPRERLWILDDSKRDYILPDISGHAIFSELNMDLRWLATHLVSRRDRLSHLDLAYIEQRLRGDPEWRPFSGICANP